MSFEISGGRDFDKEDRKHSPCGGARRGQTLVSFSLLEKRTKIVLEKQYFHEILPDYFCQGLPS